MASPDHLLLLLLTILALSVPTLVILLAAKTKSRSSNLPPGPPGWPFVGNLFQVALSGKPFFQYVRELVPIYGPIFTLRMGSRTMVIVTSADIAHEALVQKGLIFASRPKETPTRAIFSNNKFTINAASYGPAWRSLRRNIVQNALSPVRVKGFRSVRDDAMEKLMSRIRAEAGANRGRVWVLNNARFAVFSILLSMCFGLEMDEETVDRMDQTMKAVLIALDPTIDDFLPVLSPFFSKHRKSSLLIRKQQVETLSPFIDRRRWVLKSEISDGSAPFSYLDTLFELEVEGRKGSMGHGDMVSLVSEFLNGGTDTTGTAVEWAIARLIESPEIQDRLYAEIVKISGRRNVEEGDLDKMPYLNAFTKELLRKHPPTYFALTHTATVPATLGGYDVMPDTMVEFFLPAISGDPRIWSEPDKFNPERFLSGKEDADITGVTGVKMLPFGAGRRICPGLSMATIHINLILARLVQEFEWSAANGTVDFTEKFEFTVVMKNTLRASIKPRA